MHTAANSLPYFYQEMMDINQQHHQDESGTLNTLSMPPSAGQVNNFMLSDGFKQAV
jgi:hypothetical protein